MAIVVNNGIEGKIYSTCNQWKPLTDFPTDRTHGQSQSGPALPESFTLATKSQTILDILINVHIVRLVYTKEKERRTDA
jgi:hypothetical protein